MAKLKAGSAETATDFADSMAAAIEDAMRQEWSRVKNESLPAMGEQDRRILFAAIAQGVLQYLKAHKLDIATTNVLDTASGHSHTLEFDVE
jgi:hypothetical protein